MPLVAGTQLGAYEIVSLIGAGGMGEVYRARDTRLGRDVALKTLPDSVTQDPERLARFRREAQVLAALNHQHIASIYGLEEIDRQRFLVLELVDGETLATRIDRGALPLEEAIGIAREIAEALESAHEKGIVHRDLKPANIALTSRDRVKVLDFGLAKAVDPCAGPDSVAALNSPTITSPSLLTRVGVILGTAAYMSPEQTRGRAADKRSDVWAFGCVLFEMLTGGRAFDGDDVSETLAAVLRSDPPWDALPPSLPQPIRALLKGCLEKNHRERIGDMSTALFVLKQESSRAADRPAPAPGRTFTRAWPLAAAVAGSLAVGAAAAVVFWPRASVRPAQVVRFGLPITAGRMLVMQRRAVAVSPDGSHVAYAADDRIYIRALAETDVRPLVGADPGIGPAFSPDGQSIAFWGNGFLKRVSISGGAPVTICETPSPDSLDWDASGIVFAQRQTGIVRVSSDGGTPEPIVRLEANDGLVSSVQMLPDGDTVLFSVFRLRGPASIAGTGDVFIQSIKSAERKRIVEGGVGARYLPTGHLVYMVEGTLMLAAFDTARREVTPGPVPVIQGVSFAGAAHYAVSQSGVLVYIPGPARFGQDDMFLYDRKGAVTPLPIPRGFYANPRVSPDGKRVAVQTYDGNQAAISIYDLSGANAIRRLTFGGNNSVPVWSRDSTRVAFQSDREGDQGIFWQPADGGAAERLTRAEPRTYHLPESWSPVEDVLLYSVVKDAESTLWALSLRDRSPSRVGDVTSIRVPTDASFSPDGRWIAYQAGERARFGEPGVYVQPFPVTGTKYEVARGGRPMWARDGRELFFVPAPGQFVAVSVRTLPNFSPPVLVPRRFGVAPPGAPRPYDVLPDGRFVAVGLTGQTADQDFQRIEVIVNWFEELKRQQQGAK